MTKSKKLRILFYKIITRGSAHPLIAWTETLLISAFAAFLWTNAISIEVTDASDTVSMSVEYTHEFFWPLLFVLLIALRYGFTLGLVSSISTIVLALVFYKYHGIYEYFSFKQAVGILTFAMITGEFRDAWDERLHKNDLNFDFMTRKLDLFTQNYFLLRSSHDQLEQRMAGQVVSLRSNISELEKLNDKYPILSTTQEKRLGYLANPVLSLLSSIVGIEEAGFYKVENNKIDGNPIATAGNMPKLDFSDPMLNEMLENHNLLSPIDMYDNDNQPKYQLCIPLVDSTGNFLACVIATQVKFFTLTAQNVAILNLVSSYAADMLSTGIITPILQSEQKPLFLKYLGQAIKENTVRNEQSSIIFCKGHSKNVIKIFDKTISNRRGADIYWRLHALDGDTVLVVLLPLTSLFQAQMYLDRVQTQFNRESEEGDEISIKGPMYVSSSNEQMIEALKQLGVNDEDIASCFKLD